MRTPSTVEPAGVPPWCANWCHRRKGVGTEPPWQPAQGGPKKGRFVLGKCIQFYSIPTVCDPLTRSDGETQEGAHRHVIPSSSHSRLQNRPRRAAIFCLSHPGQGHGCWQPIQECSGCWGHWPQPGAGGKARHLSAETCSIPWSPRRCQGPAQGICQELLCNPEEAA